MTVFFIGCTFVAFVVVLIIILIYLQQTSTSSSKFNRKVEKAKKRLKPIFTKLVNNKNINESYVDEIVGMLNHRADITAFNDIYSEYVTKNGKSKKLKDVVDAIIVDDVVFNKKIYKGKYKVDYALYLYSFYEITTEYSLKYAFLYLNSESLYTRINAIEVIENSTDVNDYINVLNTINKNSHYISEKIVVDFLISFKGDRKNLNQLLVKNFNEYKIELQKYICNYFTLGKCDADEIKKLMIRIFDDNHDNELVIASIKYFGVVIDTKAQKYITKFLDSEVIEIKLLSSKFAYNYASDSIKHKLKRNLTDPNWYVRNNAANSLIRMDYTEDDVKEILNNKDKFAIETFQFALNSKKVK